MAFNINSVNIQFQNGQMSYVVVYFNHESDNLRNNINGSIQLDIQEYIQNASNDLIVPLVKRKVVEFVNEVIPEENTTETTGDTESTE